MPPGPEELARRIIDQLLTQSGWTVQDCKALNLSAAPGIAVREFPLKSGFADYLLYADQRAIGVVEAKPAGHTLTGVETQSAKYLSGLPRDLPSWSAPGKPLPFAYESTGDVTQFTSALDPEGRWRSYDYDELMKRDKANLDILWLKDKSLEDGDDLPEPDVLAAEIAEYLRDALTQFAAIAGALKDKDCANAAPRT